MSGGARRHLKAQRDRVADQLPEHAFAAWQRTDLPPYGLVNADRDEPLKLGP